MEAGRKVSIELNRQRRFGSRHCAFHPKRRLRHNCCCFQLLLPAAASSCCCCMPAPLPASQHSVAAQGPFVTTRRAAARAHVTRHFAPYADGACANTGNGSWHWSRSPCLWMCSQEEMARAQGLRTKVNTARGRAGGRAGGRVGWGGVGGVGGWVCGCVCVWGGGGGGAGGGRRAERMCVLPRQRCAGQTNGARFTLAHPPFITKPLPQHQVRAAGAPPTRVFVDHPLYLCGVPQILHAHLLALALGVAPRGVLPAAFIDWRTGWLVD